MIKKHIFIKFLLILAGFSSCYDKEFTNVSFKKNWKPTFGLAVGKSKLFLQTYIEKVDTSLKEYEDGLLYFLIQKNIYKLKANDLLKISDIKTSSFNQAIPAGTFFFGDSISINGEIDNGLGERNDTEPYIDEIRLKSAKLSINFEAEGIAPARLILNFHKIIKDGSSLSVDIPLKSGSSDVNKTIDLEAGDRIYFTNPMGNNSFPVSFELIVYKDGRTTLNGNFSFSASISNIKLQHFTGYLGRYTYLSGLEEINLEIYNNLPEEINKIPDDTKFINDPELRLYIDNSFGVPLFVYFPNLYLSSGNSGNSVEVSGDFVLKTKENSLPIAYPKETISSEKTHIYLNKDNSNINEALHILPDDIKLQAGVYVNKNGYTDSNFISDSSTMELTFEFEMPLSAKIPFFTLKDTFPFSFNNISKDLSQIEYVELKFTIYNGFPTSANNQVYLANEHYEYIDSLFLDDARFIASGELNDNRTVVSTNKSNIVIRIDNETIQELGNIEYLIFKTEIKTGEKGEWVKFYSDYSMEVHIGFDAQISVFEERE